MKSATRNMMWCPVATDPAAKVVIAAAVCLCALPHVQCASIAVGDYGDAAAGGAEAAAAQQARTSSLTNTASQSAAPADGSR